MRPPPSPLARALRDSATKARIPRRKLFAAMVPITDPFDYNRRKPKFADVLRRNTRSR